MVTLQAKRNFLCLPINRIRNIKTLSGLGKRVASNLNVATPRPPPAPHVEADSAILLVDWLRQAAGGLEGAREARLAAAAVAEEEQAHLLHCLAALRKHYSKSALRPWPPVSQYLNSSMF